MEIENILAALVQKAATEPCNWRFHLSDTSSEIEGDCVLLATFLPLEISFDIYDDSVFVNDLELPQPAADIIAARIMDAMIKQVRELADKRMKNAEKPLKTANVVPIKPDKPN